MLNVLFMMISIITGFFVTLSVFQLYSIMYFWVVLLVGLIAYIVCFILFFVWVFILSLFVSTKKKYTKPNKLYNWTVREACDYIISVLRIRVKIKGKEKLPRDTNFLLVGNHISNLDPILVLGTFKSRIFGAIAKPEIIKLPVIGKVIYRSLVLPIDRENPRNAVGTIVQAGDLMKNAGVNMVLYPEGTRNKGEAPLLPFKNGGFKIAQKAATPIVVVKTIGSNMVLKQYPFVSTVTLDIVDVIYPKDYEGLNTNDMGDKARLALLGDKLYNEEKKILALESNK